MPGHGGGEAEKKDTGSMRTAIAKDPFADFEEHPRCYVLTQLRTIHVPVIYTQDWNIITRVAERSKSFAWIE